MTLAFTGVYGILLFFWAFLGLMTLLGYLSELAFYIWTVAFAGFGTSIYGFDHDRRFAFWFGIGCVALSVAWAWRSGLI